MAKDTDYIKNLETLQMEMKILEGLNKEVNTNIEQALIGSEDLEKDKYAYSAYFSSDTKKMLRKLGLEDRVDAESQKNRLFVLETFKDKDALETDFRKFRNVILAATELTIEEYETEDVLHLGILTPRPVTLDGKEVFVWLICERSKATLLKDASRIRTEGALGNVLGDNVTKRNERIVSIGTQLEAFSSFGNNLDSRASLSLKTLRRELAKLGSNSVDILMLPYSFSAFTLMEESEKSYFDIAAEIERVLAVNGRAYIFSIKQYEDFEYNAVSFEKAFARHCTYNGGGLQTKIHQSSLADALVVKKVDTKKEKQTESAAEINKASLKYIEAAIKDSYLKGDYHNVRVQTLADIRKATFSQCIINSRRTLEYLQNNHGEHFPRLILLTSYANNETHPFRADSDKHAIFLAKDSSGIWYAGSPANFREEEVQYPNPLTNIMQSSALQELLQQVQKAEGGAFWGTQDFIEKADYVAPRQVGGGTTQEHFIMTTIHVYPKEDGEYPQLVKYRTHRLAPDT